MPDAPDRSDAIAPTAVLRPGLLDGLHLVVAGPGDGFATFADAVAAGSAALGASVAQVLAGPDEDVVQSAVAALPSLADTSVLVIDGAGLLARFASDGSSLADDGAALSAALASTWNVVRAFVLGAPLAAERPGRIIAIAPPDDGRPPADAARAALENLARTLSVEWARHGITTVSIAPGPSTTPDEVAGLVAFVASPAGAYYSGCELDLRGPAR